jgi:hypothetical protein
MNHEYSNSNLFRLSGTVWGTAGRAVYETDTAVTSRMRILRQIPPEFIHSLVMSVYEIEADCLFDNRKCVKLNLSPLFGNARI